MRLKVLGLFLSLAIFSPISTNAKYEAPEAEKCERNVNDTTIEVSYEDAQRLMKIAFAEGGNQGIDGQRLIMEVVWNRVKSPDYPNTIFGVISQRSQFTSYSTGRYDRVIPTTETHLALAEFEKNLNSDKNIIGFETTNNSGTLLKYFDYAYTFRDHDFYVEKQK